MSLLPCKAARAVLAGFAAALLITGCASQTRTTADDGILAAETAMTPAGQGEYTVDITVRNVGTTEPITLYYDCDMLVWLSDFIINDACASQRPLALAPGESRHEQYVVHAYDLAEAAMFALNYRLASEQPGRAPQRQLELPIGAQRR